MNVKVCDKCRDSRGVRVVTVTCGPRIFTGELCRDCETGFTASVLPVFSIFEVGKNYVDLAGAAFEYALEGEEKRYELRGGKA